ncbi:pentapeptide repeat-containing protein [Calothrix sp. NIES-4071]|nr:pentapeptide repeat-containing protein [Calothrix sp. NIES-4071]BAZ58806.1 pentapeptide repeat-containing protein [Calothrix sp. NIES-4105]
MSASKTDALKNKLTAFAVVFTAAPMLFFLIFSQTRHLSERQKIESMNQAFTTSATYFLGLAVFANAYYARLQASAMQRNAIASEKRNQQLVSDAQIAQERLVTDRLMTAITQLGHDNVATRTGAIYVLEGVANESEKSYWTVMEILTAFVRENAPINYELEDGNHELLRVRTDIQAALNVIGRRDIQKDRTHCKLNLRNTDIRCADLRKANLQHLDLRGSYLCHADLRGADLALADLDNCNFAGSILFEANLHKANLRSCNLQAANLNRAWICGANLQAANLERASLRGANMSGANLYKANLQFANLKVANLSRAKLFLANLQGAKLGKANLHNTGLIGANLCGANLNGANLTKVNLNAARLHESEAFFANFTNASLQETDLYRANLMGSNFQKAVFHETNLCGANLMGVNLEGASFNNVRWDGANLSGAKMSEFEPHQQAIAVAE